MSAVNDGYNSAQKISHKKQRFPKDSTRIHGFTFLLSKKSGNEVSAVLVTLQLVVSPVTGEGEEDGNVPLRADGGQGDTELVEGGEEVVSEDPKVAECDV